MPVKYEIRLDDPNRNGVYYAGQTVTGSLTLNLQKNNSFQCITAAILGFAHWTKTEKYGNTTYVYEGLEKYANEEMCMLQGEPHTELPEGQHIYNFVFDLSRVIPPSFESKIGHIRYQIAILIERPWKLNTIRKVQFTVLIPLDLNTFDRLIREPSTKNKNYKFFLSNNHKLELRIGLERTGFAIGDKMRINVDAKNFDKSDIDWFRFTIDQILTFATWKKSGKRVTKCERVEKFSKVTSGVAREMHSRFNVAIIIPYMPVTIYTSRVISIAYELTVVPSSQSTPISVPIVIGNIALRDTMPSNVPEYENILN